MPGFGQVWAEVQVAAPDLHRQRVAVADLPEQMARAEYLVSVLRRRAGVDMADMQAMPPNMVPA